MIEPRAQATLRNPREARRTSVLVTVFILALGLTVSAFATQTFLIRHVDTHLESNVYLLDADLEVGLESGPLEALKSGVPLDLILEFEVLRARKWLWNTTVTTLQARYVLKFNPLSRQYRLENSNAGSVRNLRSISEALAEFGRIRDFPLIDKSLLDEEGKYLVQLRMRLDIEALPAPLRPVAYVSSDWQLASEWYSWPIQR